MCKVHAHIGFVIGIVKVVNPHSCVGIYINNVCVQEIVLARQLTCNRFAMYLTLLVDVGGIFRYHDNLVVVDRHIGIEVAQLGIETVATLRSLGIVIHLIAIVELCHIQLLATCNGVNAIYTLDGTSFVLIGIAPGYSLVPVEVGFDRIALFVLLNLKDFVTAVCGVGKAFANDRVAHPEYKLLILRVGNLSLVHIECIYRNTMSILGNAPHAIFLGRTHLVSTTAHQYHTIGGGLGPRHTTYTCHLARVLIARCACCQQCCGGD